MYFLEWKCMNFDQDFTEVCSQGSNQQYFSIGSDNGLTPSRREAIFWTNDWSLRQWINGWITLLTQVYESSARSFVNKIGSLYPEIIKLLGHSYRSFVDCDNFVGLVHLNWFMKNQSSLLLIMSVLCGVIQNKATSQNYHGLKTTLPELLRENFRGADLSYELNFATVKERCDYFTSIMMFRAINGLTP